MAVLYQTVAFWLGDSLSDQGPVRLHCLEILWHLSLHKCTPCCSMLIELSKKSYQKVSLLLGNGGL